MAVSALLHDRVRSLYLSGQLSEEGLQNAVTKGWITEEEKAVIVEEKANA